MRLVRSVIDFSISVAEDNAQISHCLPTKCKVPTKIELKKELVDPVQHVEVKKGKKSPNAAKKLF